MALLFGNEVRKLVDGYSLNAFATGAVTVLPALTKDVVLTKIVLRCTAANAVATPATVKAERNPAAGDLFLAEELVGVTAVGDIWVFDAVAKGLILPAGTPLDINVTVAATGTSQTLAADVIGYVVY